MSMRPLCMAALFGVTLAMASAAASAAGPRDTCAMADEIAGTVNALPKVAEAMKPGGTLRVLAIGSATLFGPETSLLPGTVSSQALGSSTAPVSPSPILINREASEKAFPRQMAKVLQATIPTLKVEVTVRGGRGMSAGDMLSLLQKELAAGKYQLVLWQTGTVEAVRNTPPGEFALVLSQGAESVEAAGANLVLIDPQYSRFLQTNSNLDPYIQALQQTAAMSGVLLFHRFDLMRNWANDGLIDLERTPKADRTRVGEALHACLGVHLARLVVAGTRS